MPRPIFSVVEGVRGRLSGSWVRLEGPWGVVGPGDIRLHKRVVIFGLFQTRESHNGCGIISYSSFFLIKQVKPDLSKMSGFLHGEICVRFTTRLITNVELQISGI